MSLSFSELAQAELDVQWQPTSDDRMLLLQNYLDDSGIVDDLDSLIDEHFSVEMPWRLHIGEFPDVATPGYEPDTRTIRLPLEYLARATITQNELIDTTDQRELALARALDVVEYTLYHLVGHAMVDSDDPEQDELADDIASWLLMEFFPAGAEQWLADIEAFSDASQKLDGPLSDYWHSHGLYAAQERRLKCLVLGREPALAERLTPVDRDPETDRDDEMAACLLAWDALSGKVRARLSPWLAD